MRMKSKAQHTNLTGMKRKVELESEGGIYTEPGGATRLALSLHQLGNQAALVAPPAR